MIVNVGGEYVMSTDFDGENYVCNITFPITKEDFVRISIFGDEDGCGFVVDNDWRGEDE